MDIGLRMAFQERIDVKVASGRRGAKWEYQRERTLGLRETPAKREVREGGPGRDAGR